MGSTRLITDSAGATGTATTVTYDPQGNTIATSGTLTSNLQFQGQYTDSESGLLYLRARFYDSTIGQFLSRDALVSETRNAYGYVMGDALNRSDAMGLDDDTVWCSDLDRMTDAESCTPRPPSSDLGKLPVGTIQCNGDPSFAGTLCYQIQPVNNGTAVAWAMVKRESAACAVAGMLGRCTARLGASSNTLDEVCSRLNKLADGVIVDPAATSGSPNAVPDDNASSVEKVMWVVNIPGNFWHAIRNDGTSDE